MQNLPTTMLFVIFFLHTVTAYDNIYMGHATSVLGYDYVCHQRTIPNTSGGKIDARKEYYEDPLKNCEILLSSPPGTIIDFRFTDMDIIASSLQTCEDASLQIYDGSTTNATSLLRAFPNGICGRSIPSFYLRSTGNQMLLKFKATSPYSSRFSAIYTGYSPRTSVFCFYCGDLCLQKSQICDGLPNCWGKEDEVDCDASNPSQPASERTDVKLILIVLLGGVIFIILSAILLAIIRIKLKQLCQKRRNRRAHNQFMIAMHSPRPHHLTPQRTASGTSAIGRPGYGLGLNIRPYMAGPTVMNPTRVAGRPLHRSDMPPPYSEVPGGAESVVEGSRATDAAVASPRGNQETSFTDNLGYVADDDMPHISDEEDTEQKVTANAFTVDMSHANVITQDTSNDIVIDQSQSPTAATIGNVTMVTPSTENQKEHPVQQQTEAELSTHDGDFNVVVPPERVIDNYAVDVSARDTIQEIDNPLVDDATVDTGGDHGEVIYI